MLRAAEVRATFFLQGRWVEAFPDTARQVVKDGHLVGSHSFYHARLPLLSDEGMAEDIREAERAIREIAGVDPRPWFRCPFFAGADDPRVLGILAQLGYRDVAQHVVLEDWEPSRTGAAMAADALRLVPEIGDGAVVQFHTWPPGTLDALPPIIDGLHSAGAEFVRIDELPAVPGGVSAGGPP
jgi:peptidoglycan/xylan/chitin deacetylase (PgdA/CDA1 family)